MGGVLKAAPIEQAAVEHIRAGGDLCLICHKEEHVTRAFEGLMQEAETDRSFAQRVTGVGRATCLRFKKDSPACKRRPPAPTPAKIDKSLAPALGIQRASQAWEARNARRS